jgi:ubiquinone/menaquinone biosynthesis C-methylase UbiE
MNNKNNKNWWNNNPMTYLDWNLKKSDRLVTQKINFRKLNETYLQTNPYLIKKFKKIKKKNFLKNNITLDLGCGFGSSSILLANYSKRVYAIDISEKSIAGTKKNLKFFSKKKVVVKKLDAEKLDFKSNFFDYIYSWGVIHHSNNPNKIYQNIYKTLKKGGKLFFMVYNKHSIRYYFLGLYYLFFKFKILRGYVLDTVQKFFTDGYYHKHYTSKELFNILKNLGFKKIKIETDYMTTRIFPGIRQNSKLDLYLKKKFGWFLIVNCKK